MLTSILSINANRGYRHKRAVQVVTGCEVKERSIICLHHLTKNQFVRPSRVKFPIDENLFKKKTDRIIRIFIQMLCLAIKPASDRQTANTCLNNVMSHNVITLGDMNNPTTKNATKPYMYCLRWCYYCINHILFG